MQSTKTDTVEISQELRAKLDSVLDSRKDLSPFTPEVDSAIREYWPRKNKEQLAEALGIPVGRMRRRYKELTGE